MYRIEPTTIRSGGHKKGAQISWSAQHMQLDQVEYQGDGETVGVLDTGCDWRHPELVGNARSYDCISNGVKLPESEVNPHGTFVTGQIVASGRDGHILGAASGAKALSCRVLYGTGLDFNRPDMMDDVARAIRLCVDEGCGVINMSLGGPNQCQVMRDALEYAVSNGVIPVAAAGNERLTGSQLPSYPASYESVISVASANKKDLPAWYSSTGTGRRQDVCQPEVAISSRVYYWGCLTRGRYGRMFGTSMATPVLAAVALRWRQAKRERGELPTGSLVLSEFRHWLRRVVNDTNHNGWDPELGYGVLLLNDQEIADFGR